MSNSVDSGGRSNGDPFKALEGAVGEALDRLAAMTRRAEEAERQSAELNELMRRVARSPADAGDLLTRLKRLEDENVDLRERIERGREGVERLLARVRFLENQR